jgi:hypothetical protein
MMIVSKQNLRALTKEMFLNLMNEKGLAALEIIRNFNKKEREKTMDKKLIEKIKDIVEDHLCNTEINKIELCEDTHDHYLLGKWDLAQEINDVLIRKKRGCTKGG